MGWLKDARERGETFGRGGFLFGRGGFWELVKREAWFFNGQRSTTDWDVMRLTFVNTEAFWGVFGYTEHDEAGGA